MMTGYHAIICATSRSRVRRISFIKQRPTCGVCHVHAPQRRCASSVVSGTTGSPILLNPQLFHWRPIRSLSPSSISLYKDCPQSFLFKRIFGLEEPPNKALLKGSLVHKALEGLFQQPPDSRSLEALEQHFEEAWQQTLRKTTLIKNIFPSESDQVEWIEECYHLLHNYYELENPTTVTHPTYQQEFIKREVELIGEEIGLHQFGGTFVLTGLYDRLDEIPNDTNPSDTSFRLIDYKTSKAPDLHYSEKYNQKILDDSFEQLVIYALILRYDIPHIRYLRLMHLTTPADPSQGQWFECDLGASMSERTSKLDNIHAQLSLLWVEIQELWQRRNALDWKPCCRSFCFCHVARKKFLPGTLVEPAPSSTSFL